MLNRDIYRLLLLEMDLFTLGQMRMVNKEIRHLCDNKTFWEDKANKNIKFPFDWDKVLSKYEDIKGWIQEYDTGYRANQFLDRADKEYSTNTWRINLFEMDFPNVFSHANLSELERLTTSLSQFRALQFNLYFIIQKTEKGFMLGYDLLGAVQLKK